MTGFRETKELEELENLYNKYRKYSPDLKYNLESVNGTKYLKELMEIYLSAFNTADKNLNIRRPMLESIESFDNNVSKQLNEDINKSWIFYFLYNMYFLKRVLRLYFNQIKVENFIEFCNLYLFLDIAEELYKLPNFAKYSFNSKEAHETDNIDYSYRVNLAGQIVCHFKSRKEVLWKIVKDYLKDGEKNTKYLYGIAPKKNKNNVIEFRKK